MDCYEIIATGEYESDEVAWEELTKKALEVYCFNEEFYFAVECRFLLKLYIIAEKIFPKWNIKEVYDIPIFVGLYNDKLTNNNLLDEIHSISII